MGVLIVPFILGAIISFLLSTIRIYKLVVRKKTNSEQFAYGLVLASIIYGLIILSYIGEKQYWALGPLFTFPFFMFIMPCIIALITSQSLNRTLKKLSIIVFISIIFSGLFFLLFNDLAFGVLDKLGLEKHY